MYTLKLILCAFVFSSTRVLNPMLMRRKNVCYSRSNTKRIRRMYKATEA